MYKWLICSGKKVMILIFMRKVLCKMSLKDFSIKIIILNFKELGSNERLAKKEKERKKRDSKGVIQMSHSLVPR